MTKEEYLSLPIENLDCSEFFESKTVGHRSRPNIEDRKLEPGDIVCFYEILNDYGTSIELIIRYARLD